MKPLITFITFFSFACNAFAAETVGEKVDAKANDIKRSVKHAVNKGEEAVCAKGDTTCLAKKAEHRGGEAKDYVKDKAKEGKNVIDKNND